VRFSPSTAKANSANKQRNATQPLGDRPSKDGGDVELQWECMADVESEPVDWLWPARIARGKLTLIAGDPGMGKSQIALDIVARISKGAQFPDGSTAATSSALILTAEDAANDTVRPRLEAADADLARVHRLKAAIFKDGARKTFSLQHDLTALSKKLNEVGDVSLVIVDPITSYMGSKIDSHRVTDVRAVLEPLAAWAEEHKIAGSASPTRPKARPPRPSTPSSAASPTSPQPASSSSLSRSRIANVAFCLP
jgi:predicted ATP-dependent serine protease